MNWAGSKGFAWLLLMAWLGWAAAPVLAGERIVFPSNKSTNTAPIDPKAAAKELLLFREKPSLSPLDALNVPVITQPMRDDAVESRRNRLQRLERENWMIIPQGELTAEEDEKNFLGVRDYSVDDLDKDNERQNLMFRPLKKGDGTRTPGQFRSQDDKKRLAGQKSEREKSANGRETRDELNIFSEKEDSQQGLLGERINLKRLFEPRDGGDSLDPRFNKSDLTLQSLLNLAVDPAQAREQETRREEFRQFLNKSAATPLSGPADPINSREDLTRQPLHPTMPQVAVTEPPGRSGNLLGAPGLGRSTSPLAPALPTINSPQAIGFSAGTLLAPQEPSRLAPKLPAQFEIPKRRF